jgi:hypothetical protein
MGDHFNTLESETYREIIPMMEDMIGLGTYVCRHWILLTIGRRNWYDWAFVGVSSVPACGEGSFTIRSGEMVCRKYWWKMILKFTEKSIMRGQQSLIVEFKDQMSERDLHTHGGLFLYDLLFRCWFRFAAADTTGNAISYALWHSVHCRRAWNKLCDEIRVLKKEELTLSRLNHLPYLNAVIQESLSIFGVSDSGMRINPTVSVGHRREVPVDTVIAGHLVPAGVRLPPTILIIDYCFKSCLFHA